MCAQGLDVHSLRYALEEYSAVLYDSVNFATRYMLTASTPAGIILQGASGLLLKVFPWYMML